MRCKMTIEQAPRIEVEEHLLLRLAAFTSHFPVPLSELPTPAEIQQLLRADATAPLQREEGVRTAIRDLLRWGGYKPTGRGKPASEYLIRAAAEGALTPINLAVDVCNAVSLHSGLPISVVDLDLTRPPLRVAIAPAGAKYVFNPAGQEIDLTGLLCLFDDAGPCANAVRDAQRTKTGPQTTTTLSLIWGTVGNEERLREAEAWYRALLDDAGGRTHPAVQHQVSGPLRQLRRIRSH